MADTKFEAGTVIRAEWLNEVNNIVYRWAPRQPTTPHQYGGVGEPVAAGGIAVDDTAAVQAAILSGRDVYLPPGSVFHVSGGLTGLRPGQRLFGGGTLKKIGTAQQPLLIIPDGVDGVLLDGICFDGSRSLAQAGDLTCAVAGYALPSLTIVQCSFFDWIDSGVKLFDCARTAINGCHFSNLAENGIVLSNAGVDPRTGGTYQTGRPTLTGQHRIVNNHFESITRRETVEGQRAVDGSAIAVASALGFPMQNIVIADNNFVDCLRAVWTLAQGAGAETQNLVINSNVISGNVRTTASGGYCKGGIFVGGAQSAVISDNTLRNTANFDSNGMPTAGIALFSTTSAENDMVQIVGNTITDDSAAAERTMYGIYVARARSARIHNNQLAGARVSGLFLNSTDGALRDIVAFGNQGGTAEQSWNQVVAFGFGRTQLVPNQANDVYVNGVQGASAFVMPTPGRIVGITAKLSAALPAGEISIAVLADNVAQQHVALPSSVFAATAMGSVRVSFDQSLHVAAGSSLRVVATTSGAASLTPISLVVTLLVDLSSRASST